MSIRLKTATAVAIGSLAMAASFASDVSMADETVPNPGNAVIEPVAASSSPIHDEAAGSAPVAFAAFREIVQPLPETYTLGTPNGADLLSVPEKRYPSLAAMVADTDVSAPLSNDSQCLATAVFYESRSESLEGQLAVARVIINRAKSSRFGNSICGVIRQRGQFSFVRGGVIPAPKTSRPAWKTSIAIARIATVNAWKSEAEGALFFHAKRVSPGWGRERLAVIDRHIFYR